MVTIINKENRVRTSREHDLADLSRTMQKTPHKEERLRIRQTINSIRKESRTIKSMREQLIQAHRSGNREKVKDIHDFISKKEKYHNA